MLSHHRLPSLQRKTMAKKRGKHSGQQHRGHFMVFSLRKPPTFSMRRIAIGSYQRLQSKPRDELKLQGKTLTCIASGVAIRHWGILHEWYVRFFNNFWKWLTGLGSFILWRDMLSRWWSWRDLTLIQFSSTIQFKELGESFKKHWFSDFLWTNSHIMTKKDSKSLNQSVFFKL